MRPFILLISIIVLSSCTGYQKILKHGTAEEKLEAAKKYYDKKDYVRAQPLLEELMGLYFGKREREEIYYLYAYTHYGLSEYLIAGYHFRNFTKSYPLSEHREEAHYMSAICEYHKTLSFELDQTNTQMAINSLQSFINKYPNSGYVEDCNQRIDKLRSRLLKKVYTSAKLYYQIGEYKAAIVACENALDDYPDMINRDELRYLIADAAFIYANNSVKTAQEERFETALEKCSNYFKEYKKGNNYYQKVSRLKEQAENKLTQLRQSLQE
jgi:outer membrane protein assembly factor BamD